MKHILFVLLFILLSILLFTLLFILLCMILLILLLYYIAVCMFADGSRVQGLEIEGLGSDAPAQQSLDMLTARCVGCVSL
jgi:hypothetical protein